ncbi:uncharacterized protein SPSK_10941 [Sporothrix schenckii 1099-18]|uniref:Uncharacterized protein n=1 Tax=Sporothrix schenckii 1099-18 TaxID=1397361 RepID=A0A0F2M7V4_SPOSC|nr:uncharacterized protein SPSK_10941 [Sporothrix schenckii 1099-18]KJR84256.1 hypothetical protein SPSK_10941 [Sporothrix schenckii 1099-18]
MTMPLTNTRREKDFLRPMFLALSPLFLVCGLPWAWAWVWAWVAKAPSPISNNERPKWRRSNKNKNHYRKSEGLPEL